jgi:hypothetical protein
MLHVPGPYSTMPSPDISKIPELLLLVQNRNQPDMLPVPNVRLWQV